MSAPITQWFDGKPEMTGAWEVHLELSDASSRWYSHWNGRFWGAVCLSVSEAYEWRDDEVLHQDQVWRGLADKPGEAR